MAQSGYGYDPLHGYHQQAPYAHQPYPSYPAPTHGYPNGAVQTMVHNEPAPRDPYNPHNTIPGLGLNFSQTAAQWPGPWANQQSSFGQAPPVAIEETGPSQQTDMSEEGEVSEGELDDGYEPRDAEIIADLSYMHGNTAYPAGFSNSNGKQMADDPSAGRDRSGSYSPYLSPQEIDHHAIAGSPDEEQSNNISPPKSSQLSPKTNGANYAACNSLPAKSVAAARKQAQDAILRLWPLNVRYQNYVDEGINERLLGGLFEELGFDKALPSSTAVAESSHEIKATPGTKVDAEEVRASAPVKTKSEERKDRIARLLAAKSSKPSTSVTAASTPAQASTLPLASTPSSHTPIPRQQGSAKTQSEKSKLLYQKMEALRKARELEARGQKRPHPDALSRPNHQAKDNANESTGTASFDTTTSSMNNTSREQTPGQSESPNGHLPTSIPGLFLSSTPQPSHAVQILNLERPASTSLVDSNPRPFKRPFGQTRRSRPFLIDVSDDEDDAEMDIDSPEQKLASLPSRPITALKSTISLRNIPSAIDNAAAAQQYSSAGLTPPGASSDNHAAKDHLDSMTKKIEAMKRRIAEAEARKKARQSQPDSPALPALNDESLNTSFEAAISNKDAIVSTSLSIEPQELSRSTPPVSDTSPALPHASVWSPQSVTERRRSRSRAASERLPAIEARRREQQLKLQLLQAQVANMQLEIQRSLEEEEKLKVDVDIDSDSEQTQERQAVTPSKPSSPSSPLTDAMDMSSISPQSNDAQQGREASLPQVEETREEQQPSMIMDMQTEQSLPTSEMITAQEANTTTAVFSDANQEAIQSAMSTIDDTNTTEIVEEAHDMVISEAGDSDNADSEDGSDDYEPPDVELSSPSRDVSRTSTPFSPAPAEDLVSVPETSAHGFQDQDDTADVTPAQQISTVQQDTASESGREVDVALHVKGRSLYLIANQVDQVSEALAGPGTASPASDALQTTFVPYESPLRYFHAYRFHPEYSQSVAGGLRSLTYSNKIDVKQEMCPDELANNSCPRGKECDFQHFESMQAPDDQILLQLGAHGDFDEKKKHEYINGLRYLLTDFRNRKVKDFQTISQGIIDYRAQFLGDKSKILPLGGVTI
ncbi:hypothetical protein V8C42DRAFT_317235 [Trichoderma barbatum]